MNPITEEIDFTVKSTKAFMGIEDKFMEVKHRKAIYRTDTNDVFEFVGIGYKIIDHKKVIMDISDIFNEVNANIKWLHFIEKKGARVISYVDVVDTKHKVNNTPIILRLSFINSYDRTRSLSINPFGVIGDDMVAVGDGVKGIHTKNVDIDSLIKSIKDAISIFKSKIEFWEAMNSKEVDIKDVVDVKTAIADMLHIGKKQHKDMTQCTRKSNTMWTMFRELSNAICNMDKIQESRKQKMLIKLAKYFETSKI